MYNLYKTELPNFKSVPNSRSSFPKSTKNKTKKIKINNLLSRNDLNKKIKNISLSRKLLSENYLDFMIQEKLNYADVEKIINHYSKKIDEYTQRYDENKNLINKKKKELKDLNMTLYTNLVNHMKFETTEKVDLKQEEEIEKTKKEIKVKEHEIEVFKDLLNQSYKLNLNLSNKFFLENNYSKIYEEQYYRYNNIYKNSISKIQKQEDKLNVLNGYFNRYKIVNNSLISEKVDKLNRLEYEIVMIKNDVVDFEENLAKIQEKNEKFKGVLDSAKHGYKMRKNDFWVIEKHYLKEYYKMFEIYGIFDVEDIETILKKFIIIKQKFNELTLKFNKSSDENMKLRIELTRLEKKLKDIKIQTKEKKHQVKVDSEKSNKDIMEIINMQKNGFNISNLELYNSCINTENLINFGINHLIEWNIKIINSLNNSLNKSPLLAKKKFDLNQNIKLFENYNIKSIGMMKEKNLILIIINLFKTTIRKIYIILQNVLYNLYIKIDQKQEEQPKDDETVPEITFNIISNNSEIVEETMDSELKNIREKLRVKKQIYSRNKDQLLSHHSNQNPLNKKVRHSFSSDNIFKEDEKDLFVKKYQIISHEDLFKEFSNYNQKNPFVANDEFIGINKKLFLEEYTNELVAENDLEKIKNEKMKKVKEASRKINAKLEEKELKRFLNKKANKQRIIKLRKKVANTKLDEQGEEELKEYEKELMILKNELKESKKPKRFKMKLANPENNLINNRYEDIRLLEINYIKNYSDYRVEQNIFNEYFYNVRKKFSDINKKQINSHELNNSLSTRNLSKKRKNFSIILPKIENKAA